MSQNNAEIDVVKTEDYTPSYLSTSVDFDPQAASFFYESSTSTRVPTASTSEHMVLPKMQHPQQHQFQYQQHQQFYSHAAQLTPQQREYLLRRGAQVPMHFAVGPSPQTAVHYYSRQLNSQEQHTLAAQGQQHQQQQNVQYSMMPAMMQQQRVQRSATPVAQRVPIVVRQRQPAAAQQQFQYSGQPLGNHLRPGVQYAGDLVKTEPPDEQPTTLNDVLVKLKRKRPRKTKALDINGEGEDKGTFLVRYADLDSDEYAGHIWLVDNHQLLQKYTYDGLDASNVKIFSRTERYSGWLCTCPWLYHPLEDVRGSLGNMEKVRNSNS
ncbi:unnamed protein product [Heligmosomoides polygyrus]|uniref:TF-B3 domain-containing protein n=1 Tax=Heligmosomoides polygyrus TaxID=6339 RepID=A0A183FWG6_HELPZ|nr:unnamed protein product [Heligmosomoides polygyrus]